MRLMPFKAGSVGAHRVDELGWSTHGRRQGKEGKVVEMKE
jgi:hypothetical protein